MEEELQKPTESNKSISQEMSPEKVGEEDLESQLAERANLPRWFIPLVIALVVFILVGGVGFYLLQFSKQQKLLEKSRPLTTSEQPTPTSGVSQKPTPQVVTAKPNVTLETGFSFHLPVDWSAKISNQSKQHFFGKFFVPNASAEKTYVEIESIASSRLTKNPLITIDKTEQRKINNLVVTLDEGKENFQNSRRQVKQATFTNKGNALVLTLYQSPSDRIVSKFDALVNSVTASTQIIGSSYHLINTVYAAESIAGIDKDEYTKIEVMGDPLPERITRNDKPYEDGYAKFYMFEAFKGQRLTTVAMEDRTTNPESFIRSRLFNEQGQKIGGGDTRIEFDAPQTGIYYYIVFSFNNQEGGYLLKVFDRNQTENLLYAKYADGSERLIDSTKSPPQYGEKEVAILFQFINPIEVIDNDTVRYFAKPREFEPGLGLITTPIDVYLKEETYQDFLRPNSRLSEENPDYLARKKIVKLSPSKILIEPETGELFPQNHHIVIVEKSIGRYRFFTENPTQ